MAEQLRCVIDEIYYQSNKNDYKVLFATATDTNASVTVVGSLPNTPPEGTLILCHGQWKQHAKYGLQFACDFWEIEIPKTEKDIERYLSSGLIKGIGPTLAKRIVKAFGTATIDILDTDTDRLREVPGIGNSKLETIRNSWNEQNGIRNVMIFLQSCGVSTAYADKIYKLYKQNSIEFVRNNPYRLIDDIRGIGFKTADSIAQNMGYDTNDIRRCSKGLLFTLRELSNQGHCYAEEEQLLEAAGELLEADESAIIAALRHLLLNKEVICEKNAVYLPVFYYAETGTASQLSELAQSSTYNLFKAKIDLSKLEKETGIEYDDIQKEAINKAVTSKVMVLTGGPGTGKTTTTRAIISAFKSEEMSILLAAPTGRAAKRLSEATGMEAKTVHRLLEYGIDGFGRNEDNPLKGDVLILDECSMMDIMLTYDLLKAIPINMRLILIGDVNQLPSVGAGNVLRNIIDSGIIPVVRLSHIFRQAQTSRIVMSAHNINQGIIPDISNGADTDFFFLTEDDPETAAATITDLVKNRLPAKYGEHTDIQVLSPMKKGVIGTESLNSALQQALNHNTEFIIKGSSTFKLGDRVMQLRNNYDKEVYNGDLGHICKIDKEEGLIEVRFDDNTVEYEVADLDELTLAYATTIHKSQGSEYPIVIIPIMMNHYIMLQRNLIYTGITRAKKACILIGQYRALKCAVENMKVSIRNTRLKERLQHRV